jgi:UDP-N-acetylglucosamine transferase subunit ALG13
LIFVVTGVHFRGFDRLVKAVDDIAQKGIAQDVFMQIGFSSYEPKNCKWVRTMDFLEFEKYMDQAEAVISHGGAGCVAGALERNKTIIVVPRLKEYDEASNDNQIEFCSALEKTGRVLVAHDVADLAGMIEKAKYFQGTAHTANNCIAETIRNFLVRTAGQKGRQLIWEK